MQEEVKYSFKQWCEDNGHSDWLDLWDYELNGIRPEDVSYGSSQFFWFKCARGLHESETRKPSDLIKAARPFCCRKCHSFGQWMLDNHGADAIEKYRAPEERRDWFDISPHSSSTKVWVKCHNPTHPSYEISPNKFSLGHRCSICSNRKVVAGINDVATTHPERVKYFKYPEDVTKYAVHSGKEVWFKCPDCGAEKFMSLDAAFSMGYFACRACGDGVSYGNKFVGAVLQQLKEKRDMVVKPEKIFEWSKINADGKKARVYDFYVRTHDDIIIEAQGIQHYNNMVNRGLFRDYEIEHENDVFKRNLALTNGILPQNYIEINCSESEKEFIKQSILTSDLPHILNFCAEDIDWDRCDEFASTFNAIKKTAELWNSGVRNRKELADMIGCSKSSIYTYIKKAIYFGWMKYEAGRHERRSGESASINNEYLSMTA